MRPQKLIATAFGGAIAALVIGLTTVFACTSLATLNLSQASAPAGTNVTVTGSAFNSVSSGANPVVLHWGSVNGPVLADSITPDSSGAIGPVSITIPQSANPGYFMIVAVQTETNGQNSWGTPARAAFQVTGNGVSAGSQPSQSIAGAANNGGGVGAGFIALLAALGVGGLSLFAFGTLSVIRSYGRVPAASKIRKQ